MSRIRGLSIAKYYQIIYTAAIGAAGVLLLDEGVYFCEPNGLPKVLAAASVLIFEILLSWSQEKGIKLYVWGGTALAAAVSLAYMYKSGRNMEQYLLFLGLEAVCLLAALLSYLAGKRFILRGPLILAEIVCLICYGIDGMKLPKGTVCMVLFCVLMLLTEAAELKSARKSGLNPVYLVPVFLSVMVVFFFLPARDTPMQWTAVKSFISAAGEKVNAVIAEIEYRFNGKGENYSLPFTGYDEGGELTGSLFSTNQAQISVMGDKMNSPFYAGGTIYDTYTGSGWVLGGHDRTYQGEEYMLQYKEWKHAFDASIYTQEEIWELTRYRSCQIKYEGIKTKSLFLAPVTAKVTMPRAEKMLDQDGGSLALKRAKGVGFGYSVSFLEIDYENEKIKQLLRQQAWENEPAPDENTKKRQEFIYENYTSLPDTLPKRIKTLTDEITAGAKTDYDRMKAIEAYLHQYTYSTSVGNCPEGMDPIEYFLFESKTGYCTYFATAMALMGRCADIPTRYVEGFLTSATMKQYNEEIMLTGNNAHAWTEVYIKNIGWVPFEPTPGYGNSTIKAWNTPHAAGDISGSAPSQEGKPDITEADTEIMELPADGPFDIGGQVKKAAVVLLELLLFAILLVGILACFFWLRNYIRKQKYRSRKGPDKLKAQMTKILTLGKLSGEEIREGETLGVYAKRCGTILDTEELAFTEFCSIFEAVRFGGRPADDELLASAEHYTKLAEQRYLSGCGRTKRILYYVK